jgi:hypothetical protein
MVDRPEAVTITTISVRPWTAGRAARREAPALRGAGPVADLTAGASKQLRRHFGI